MCADSWLASNCPFKKHRDCSHLSCSSYSYFIICAYPNRGYIQLHRLRACGPKDFILILKKQIPIFFVYRKPSFHSVDLRTGRLLVHFQLRPMLLQVYGRVAQTMAERGTIRQSIFIGVYWMGLKKTLRERFRGVCSNIKHRLLLCGNNFAGIPLLFAI